MKNFIQLLSLMMLTMMVGCSNDDSTPTSAYTDAETFFTELDYQGTVIIKKDDTEILSRGFGLANQTTGESNGLNTKFRLASVSKTLTAMAVVQLKRDGLIDSFDQTISEFDDDFPNGDQITLKQLLMHQSGLPDYVGAIEPLAKSGNSIAPEDIYEVIQEEVTENGLLFSPGTSVAYSNSNFLITALLIEALSEQSYTDYVMEEILSPLGMNATEPGQPAIDGQGYARGYQGTEDVSSYPIHIALGAGNWTSTATDMLLWCEAIMGDWLTAEEKALVFPGDVPLESTLLGMGWFKSNIGGTLYYWHGGDIDGFSTMIGFIPEQQGIIITLSNQEDPTGMQREQIIETLLRKEF